MAVMATALGVVVTLTVPDLRRLLVRLVWRPAADSSFYPRLVDLATPPSGHGSPLPLPHQHDHPVDDYHDRAVRDHHHLDHHDGPDDHHPAALLPVAADGDTPPPLRCRQARQGVAVLVATTPPYAQPEIVEESSADS